MKYMLMFAGSEEYFDTFKSFPEEEQRKALAKVGAWSKEHSAAGRLLESNALQPASTATTVRINPFTRVTQSFGAGSAASRSRLRLIELERSTRRS